MLELYSRSLRNRLVLTLVQGLYRRLISIGHTSNQVFGFGPGIRLALTLALGLFSMSAASDAQDETPDETIEQRVARISDKVAELRSLQFRHPVSASVQTPEEFVRFARDEIESAYGAERLQSMSQAYQLMSLLDPGVDLLTAYLDAMRGLIGGFYSSQAGTLYVMSEFEHGGMGDVILAHELAHALDDQYFDLEQMRQRVLANSDQEFALASVVEGSAMAVMNSYVVSGLMQGFLQIDPGASMDVMSRQTEMLGEVPPFIAVSLVLPYSEGVKFLGKEAQPALVTTPDTTASNQALKNLPQSSEQILHPEKYWNAELRDDPVHIDLSDFSQTLGPDWKLMESNTLGELGIYLLTETEPLSVMDMVATSQGGWTNPAATGWGGDRYQLYAGPHGKLVMVWFSLWDSAQDRDEFLQTLWEVGEPRIPALRRMDDYEASGAIVYFSDHEDVAELDRLNKAFIQSRE